jgi:hypothetical protein
MLRLTRRELETDLLGTAPVLDPTLGGCALQAHEIQLSEMAAAAKLSQQLRTESCVVAGNGHCEA